MRAKRLSAGIRIIGYEKYTCGIIRSCTKDRKHVFVNTVDGIIIRFKLRDKVIVKSS